jgi:hypothetical protein
MTDTSQAAAWPKPIQLKRPLFHLGKVVATPGALAALEQHRQSPLSFLIRHVTGDWGNLDAEDCQANDAALVHGTRIVSSYRLGKPEDGQKLWLITEADRSATTFLLPEEY